MGKQHRPVGVTWGSHQMCNRAVAWTMSIYCTYATQVKHLIEMTQAPTSVQSSAILANPSTNAFLVIFTCHGLTKLAYHSLLRPCLMHGPSAFHPHQIIGIIFNARDPTTMEPFT
ncbi:predicted protein [Plenodomus lingam JN3]|uniref:Predicted protein n=1 Tax=Leptosphaeria maculans (strain JN3 / isolate v23.1.3 / race Av1-4-5-6-7-8) TaxID=985895 RepID=E4ZZB2_LEPMJ|nr:predicted protein [Plenodomus lingam JN3]CBX96707.1 predicted protein [Plenodomus lingam JN3]